MVGPPSMMECNRALPSALKTGAPDEPVPVYQSDNVPHDPSKPEPDCDTKTHALSLALRMLDDIGGSVQESAQRLRKVSRWASSSQKLLCCADNRPIVLFTGDDRTLHHMAIGTSLPVSIATTIILIAKFNGTRLLHACHSSVCKTCQLVSSRSGAMRKPVPCSFLAIDIDFKATHRWRECQQSLQCLDQPR